VTDAYQMSIGELVNMYESDEIKIDPEFQRLFRWAIGQKSKLIESLLLGIPLPSIFVFEKEDGTWELIDGLQRLSTILEFMGKLKSPEGALETPSILEATKYLPSLHNVVWEQSDDIDTAIADQITLEKSQQLNIRRSRISVEILKGSTDPQTKFDLFQRLNSGGTVANEQELRNCVMLMVNSDYFRAIKAVAEQNDFLSVIAISDEQKEKQRHLELAIRFLVHTLHPYDNKLDVNEFIDEGAIALCNKNDVQESVILMTDTFSYLANVANEGEALRRFNDGNFIGRVTLTALEGIAVGIAKNLDAIRKEADPTSYIRQKIEGFWQNADIENFTTPGLRGTIRIQRTVPFGETWFRP